MTPRVPEARDPCGATARAHHPPDDEVAALGTPPTTRSDTDERAAAQDRLGVVLVGAGHTNLHVLDQAPRLRAAGIDLTLVAPATFVYSGMATAVAAGARSLEEATIDVAALARRRGVRHLVGRVGAIDPATGRLGLEDGTSLGWEVAALNLGSVVRTEGLEVADDVATVKPFERLIGVRRWLSTLPPGADARVNIVGGGPTGLELAGQLAHRFGDRLTVTVLERGATPGAGLPPGGRRVVLRLLQRRGVRLRSRTDVSAVHGDHLVVDGTREAHDAAVIATGLVPPALATTAGLGQPDGIPVTATLVHPAHDGLYAVGDCALFTPQPLPRIGVHGVRQGPVLVESLLARAAGAPLPRYRPQTRALQILDLGGGTALATRGRWWATGSTMLRLKQRIDQRWLARYG